jgi:hypothetical protein
LDRGDYQQHSCHFVFQELWKGGISHWSGAKIFSFLGSFVLIPPLWVIFSLPLNNKYNKTPIVKFGCHLTSHIFFMIFQVITSCLPIYTLYNRTSISPHWNEWVICIWVSGLLLGELTSPGDRTGVSVTKPFFFVTKLQRFHLQSFFWLLKCL